MEDEVSQLESDLDTELKIRFKNLYGSNSSFDSFWNKFNQRHELTNQTNRGFIKKHPYRFLSKTYNLKRESNISNKTLDFQNHLAVGKVAGFLSFFLLMGAILSLFVVNHSNYNSNGAESSIISTSIGSQLTLATTSQTQNMAPVSTSQVPIPIINTQNDNIYAALEIAREAKLTKEVNYSSSSNGLTVTVTQLYADKNKVIIAYTISGLDSKFRDVLPGWDSLTDQNNNKTNMSFVWQGGFSNGKQDFIVSFPSDKLNLTNNVVKVTLIIRDINGYLAAQPIPTPNYNYSSVVIDHQPFSFDLEIPVNH